MNSPEWKKSTSEIRKQRKFLQDRRPVPCQLTLNQQMCQNHVTSECIPSVANVESRIVPLCGTNDQSGPSSSIHCVVVHAQSEKTTEKMLRVSNAASTMEKPLLCRNFLSFDSTKTIETWDYLSSSGFLRWSSRRLRSDCLRKLHTPKPHWFLFARWS